MRGNRRRIVLPSRQRGQALLLILLVTVITSLLAFGVLNNAILVSEKMELQNAADAAAYSVSMAEARDLNFTAYINRSMVANEVAMGQILGLMSWASMVKGIGPSLNFYLQPILSAMSAASLGILSTVQAIISGVITALTTVGNILENVVKPIARIASNAILYINLAYSTAQRTFHIATFVLSVLLIQEVIDDNDAQNFSGAATPSVSGFGFLALAGHFVTHYADIAYFGDAFVNSYAQDSSAQIIPHSPLNAELKPDSDEQKAGVERFAAMVNESRDKFTTDRDGGWSIPLFPPVNIQSRETIRIDLGFTSFTLELWDIDIRFEFAMNRRGGTDLRFNEDNGEQLYGWTSVDTTTIDADVYFKLEVLGVGFTIDPPSAGVPLGIGAAQVASSGAKLGQSQPLPIENMRFTDGLLDSDGVEAHNYGGSPAATTTTWMLPWPSPLNPNVQSPSMGVSTNNLNTSYRLPRYNDTKAGADSISINDKTFGFESPYLIIGLTKDSDDVINKDDPRKQSGAFELADGAADDEMAVIAKSEVYFSRPNDISYFARSDGAIEYANGFNPYWDARLVDTTVLDRISAIAIQQEQLWIPDLPFGVIVDDFVNIVNWVSG